MTQQDAMWRERAARVVPGGMYGHMATGNLPPDYPQKAIGLIASRRENEVRRAPAIEIVNSPRRPPRYRDRCR